MLLEVTLRMLLSQHKHQVHINIEQCQPLIELVIAEEDDMHILIQLEAFGDTIRIKLTA